MSNNNDINMNNDNQDDIEETLMHNMIEEFMNVSDEDNKIFNLLKEEFKDLRIVQYGNMMYVQTELTIEKIPNISELLSIYEEIFTHINNKTSFSINLEKYYVIYTDGFITIANNGNNKKLFIYKIRTIVLIFQTNSNIKVGCYNSRILKILKEIKYI